jgi:predicted molibdopterin-dependent oxidoreductase YjgC
VVFGCALPAGVTGGDVTRQISVRAGVPVSAPGATVSKFCASGLEAVLHNIPALMRGRDRCTLQIHPDDATARGLVDGGRCETSSDSGTIEATVEVIDSLLPGVVSLPDGWGMTLPICSSVSPRTIQAQISTPSRARAESTCPQAQPRSAG